MDLIEIGIYMKNWVDSAQDWDHWNDFVNVTVNFRAP